MKRLAPIGAMMPRRVGEILDDGLTVLLRVLGRLAIVLVLILAADAATSVLWVGTRAAEFFDIFLGVVEYLLKISYTFVIGAEWQGRSLSLNRAVKKITFPFILKVVILYLRVGLMTAAYSLLLVIPGIVYFINRVLAFTCIYFEEVSVDEALERSQFLMNQEKWYSLGSAKMRYSALILVVLPLNLVVTSVAIRFLDMVNGHAWEPFTLAIRFGAYFLTFLVLQIMFLYMDTVAVGFYFDLRTRYEALDLVE